MKLELGRQCGGHELNSIDLQVEVLKAKGEEVECFQLCSERADGQYDHNEGELLYIPSAGRAGIARGADAQWTDATSAQDAIDRYNNDEMAN